MWYMGGIHNNKEWDLNWERLLPRVWGYNKRSDIMEVDVTEFRVCYYLMNYNYLGRSGWMLNDKRWWKRMRNWCRGLEYQLTAPTLWEEIIFRKPAWFGVRIALQVAEVSESFIWKRKWLWVLENRIRTRSEPSSRRNEG